jgi:rSAM/selenodomain-associated transferase 2
MTVGLSAIMPKNTQMVTIVIPVLDDAVAVSTLLHSLPPDPAVDFLIVDGAQDQALDALAAGRADVTLIRATPGRGAQMNAGARAATQPWLLFLHADSRPPTGWLDAVRHGTSDPLVVGGWFRFRLDATACQARLIERLVALRIAVLGLAYGDQGLFVRRSTFTKLGGYREWPLMEDVDFVRRLTRAGRVIQIPLPLVTSARRWARDGWFRCSARNLVLLALYFAGVSPVRLARWYSRS